MSRPFLGPAFALAFCLSACSRPYATPVIAEEPGEKDASFQGINDLVAEASRAGERLHVIWTHGMCTHHAAWVTDRVTRVTLALGGTANLLGASESPDKLARYRYQFVAPTGTFDATFILWSPMTVPFKKELAFDSPATGANQSFPYARASLNNKLKIGLMNDCLADAVVYAGTNGDAMRKEMQRAVCYALDGKPVEGKPCDLSAADPNRPLAIITESLGSKFFFDAVRVVWAQAEEGSAEQAHLARRLSAIRMIYLLANQIPLLDIASPLPEVSPTPARAPAAVAEVHAVRRPSSLRNLLEVLSRSRHLRMQVEPARVPAPPTVVAFTDPNDLLSYRLIPSVLDVSQARLINVITSNVPTWFGFLENPETAHCGYAWNRDVIGLVANGHKVAQPVVSAPNLPANNCF